MPVLRPAMRRPFTPAFARVTGSGRSGGSAAVYPLDIVGGETPMFAYSPRKLAAGYAGPCIRVVRPSDSLEQDIGFLDNKVDAAALDMFLGTQLGQIRILYDQSGRGNHSDQATIAKRWRIGTVEEAGVRVFLGENGNMPLPAGVAISKQAMHVFLVNDAYNAFNLACQVQLGSGANQTSHFQQSSAGLQNNGLSIPNSKPLQSRPQLIEYLSSPSESRLWLDFETTSGAASASLAMVGGQLGETTLAADYSSLYRQQAAIGYARVLTTELVPLRSAMRALFPLATAGQTQRVIWEGDSTTASYFGGYSPGANGYARQASVQLPRSVAAHNIGSGGTQLQTKVAQYATNGAGFLFTAFPTGNRIVFLMMGTNDITIGGRTAEQVYADYQSYAGLVRAQGGKIIVATITANAVWDSTYQAIRNDLNASIRANWASFADGFCDFAADPTIGTQAATSNTALFPDGLHPSTLGYSYMAPLALAAVNALL